MQLFSTLRATFLTLKSTRALWLAIVAPLFIICFRTAGFLVNREMDATKYAWNNWMEGNYSMWVGIILLLTMALDIALLVDIDRSAHSWKYLFALPVSRAWMYVTKMIVAMLLTYMSGLILFVASIASGYLLAVTRPQFGFSLGSPDSLYYLAVITLETLAACFVIAIYVWVSMFAKNFILPICIGIAGTVMNIIAYSSMAFQKFSPWMYALDVSRVLTKTPQTQPYLGWPLPVLLAISISGAVVVMILGIIEFNRRDIY